ncbi:hypothetical protein S4054249_03025 [Pseudoalteromonas luteoviolacea]|uniref:DUF5625 domain-containing protein n=2 Tax=Pseudoalteromonas luteoviolacea TaxID=43657 RepID=A0A0F6A981_9GAMM|nr:hypothetical protein S4054249_03025 [Pseudoalteromonas luteoviolacea]AOT11828.1 hypothetical protein S40542_03025 [Pseudoalteromonas luteoviolacea]AOT16740.1 hypothetical protein S4054_03025 [Pseudoalteromonas luteoviolacea]KKE82762.1 hypothetical protein N479_17045 [Pseudoalteromonas luteoviolacea S4054]KZN72973.1 hypothetical protein N481_14050 [Pseudoalteromonas luteoviolacea S4047-1]
MKRKCLLTLLCIGIVGCQSAPFTYNPEEVEHIHLAKVIVEQGPRQFAHDYVAVIEYIWNEQGKELSGRLPYVSAKFDSLNILPGVYRIQAKCANKQHQGSVEGIFNFEPASDYRLYCELKQDRHTLGFSVSTHVALKLEKTAN